ncbi:(3,5-dihydroxyphenyl)acetyl-CoA 1,2-dioxygenase DpgC [Actinoplanes sp. NPDC051346]|uniref:(3,5-dihydroxyphenyl)acetyl-CoA 1,2-dioxygenase DpgC n=1 Tax=Actinoplanes sp. NPDC051346 TaxID=3155048 RepID=UPI0034476CE0
MVPRWFEPWAAGPEAEAVTAAADRVATLRRAFPVVAARTPRQRQELESARQDLYARSVVFLRKHADRLYDEITAGRSLYLRIDEICDRAARLVPGLVPSRREAEEEQLLPPAQKEGRDVEQAILLSHLLRSQVAGLHMLEAMRRPTERAQRLLPTVLAEGEVTLGSVAVELRDGAAYLTMHRDDCLNAEDNEQVEDMETAVDLAMLAPTVRVGVLRGGVMTHPKYAGRRVFSSGINLRKLHSGEISFLNFLMRRELGYIAKIIHGLSGDPESAWRGSAVHKPWLAVVDAFAIGGGAQVMLACDRIIAERGAYFSLPAAQEGIVPGAANLRLTRAVGTRLSRQIILTGQRVTAGEPEGSLLFDEVWPARDLDLAVETEVRRLDSPAVVANRHMLNVADEPADDLRRYLADFAVEQAERLYSKDVMNKVTRFTSGAHAGTAAC